LGEDEGVPVLPTEGVDEVSQGKGLARVSTGGVGRLGDEPLAAALLASRLLEMGRDHVSGDGEQPHPDGGAVPEGGQGPQCPQVCLLGEVVGNLNPRKVGNKPPYVALGAPHQLGESVGVPAGSGFRQTRELVVPAT